MCDLSKSWQQLPTCVECVVGRWFCPVGCWRLWGCKTCGRLASGASSPALTCLWGDMCLWNVQSRHLPTQTLRRRETTEVGSETRVLATDKPTVTPTKLRRKQQRHKRVCCVRPMSCFHQHNSMNGRRFAFQTCPTDPEHRFHRRIRIRVLV